METGHGKTILKTASSSDTSGSLLEIELVFFLAITVKQAYVQGCSLPLNSVSTGGPHVYDSISAFVVSVCFVTATVACESFSAQDSCQKIDAWNCGSGAYLDHPGPLTDIVDIDAGDIFTIALLGNGQIVSWGNAPNDPIEYSGGNWAEPYLLPQQAQFQTLLIAAGQEHGAALLADGRLIEWHHDATPDHTTQSNSYQDVTAMAAGGDGPVQDVWNGQPHYPFLMVLQKNGSLTVLGDNAAGLLGNSELSVQNLPKFPGKVRAIAAGRSHALALTEEGVVIGWGNSDHGVTEPPASLLDEEVVAIASGKDHSLVILSNGTVLAWGRNDDGQCDVPAGLSDVVAIAGGEAHSAAVRSDGTVVCWGSDEFGQCSRPESSTQIERIECGRWHTVALSKNGTIEAWGDDRYGQSSVNADLIPELTRIRSLAVGSGHRLAVDAKGDVFGWGDNQQGQIDVPDSLGPTQHVAAANGYSLALEDGGTVIAWGANQEGQCEVPDGLKNVQALSAGSRHVLALRSDGTVVAWGANESGQCDVPQDLTGVIAIATGELHSLALRFDGTLESWGSNAIGQSQPPDGLQNVRAIGAGAYHSLAVGSDGVVVAWGANGRKQTEVPDDLPPIISIQGGANYSIATTAAGELVGWGDCGERRPGPASFNRHYPIRYPTAIDNHLLVAAGPYDIMTIRDLCPPCSPADLNRDATVDERDMLLLYDVLGQACVGDFSNACSADLNQDGAVGFDDLSLLFQQWGPCNKAVMQSTVIRRDPSITRR